jgi:TRAP-type C4-dicarboxylate transport system permease small subunit
MAGDKKRGGVMHKFSVFTVKFSRILNIVGGTILVLMMLLTVVDVVLRYLGKPITGTYELMAFSGALVIGFAIAQASLDDAHVSVDMVTDRLSLFNKTALLFITKLMSLVLFALISLALFIKAHDLYKTGEVSLTLRVPYYPVAYGLSLCGFAECLVLLSDILRIVFEGGKQE